MPQYNVAKYNEDRYNANFEGYSLKVADELNLSRFSGYNTFKYNTQRYNANSTADDISKSWGILIADTQFVQDNNVSKKIAKGFTEEVRLAAWLNKKRTNPANWSD